MKLRIIPLEERIVLDAAAAVTVLAAAAEHTTEASTAHADASHADTHVVDAIPPPPSQTQAPHVLVVSSDLQDPQGLINAAKSGVQTLYYDAKTTTLEQLQQRIADLLNGQKAESIAFAAEGNKGVIQLVDSNWVQLNSVSNSPEMQAFWKSIGNMLTNTGHIDLLSCNFAGSIEGEAQVAIIDSLIGDGKYVTASTDLTGNTNGADWLLEIGNIDAKSLYFNSDQLAHWDHSIATAIQYGLIAAQIAILVGGVKYVGENTTFTDNGNSLVNSNGFVGTITTGPSHAADFTFNSSTLGFTYTPVNGYVGTDTFTYTLTDPANSANSSTYTINLNVTNSTLPAANSDSYTVNKNTPLIGSSVFDNDLNTTGASAQIVSAPQHGTITFNPDGSFIYTPTNNFTGLDAFSYRDVVGVGASNNALIFIFVRDTPVIASNDSFTVLENSALNGTSVLANDTTNISNQTLTAQLVTGPANGTISLNSDGTFIYTPALNFYGTDSFTYQATNANGDISNISTANITVTPLPPVANNDFYTSGSGVPLNGASVFANDTNVNGLPLTAQLVSGPQAATLTLNADGTFIYNSNIAGTQTFTYRVVDSLGDVSNIATVTLTTLPRPNAGNDVYAVAENALLNGASVLANDSSSANLGLTAQLVTGPTHGILTLNADGTFIYTPALNFYGTDTFTYVAADSLGSLSSIATAAITVSPLPPVANSDAYIATENAALNGASVLANDTNINNLSLTAQLVSGPANGTITLNADGSFIYTPSTNFYGTDSFTYKAVDSLGGISNSITATITVKALAPVANNDTYIATQNAALNGVSVLANDGNINNLPLTAQLVSGPANGTIVLNADGTFLYNPVNNYYGTDSFTYTTTDSLGNVSNTATGTITVKALPPVANNDIIAVNQNSSISANLFANDININQLALTAVVVSGPTHGTISAISGTGLVTYTPTIGFIGADSFSYDLVDSLGNISNIATVTINIAAVAPIAASDSYTTLANLPKQNFNSVLTNDTSSTSSLTAQLVQGPSHGSLVLNSNGSFSYQAALGFSGIDTFTYRAVDAFGTVSNIATVSINSQDVVTQEPILQLKGNINSTWIENKSPTILANNVKIQDVNTTTFNQGQLIVEFAANGTADDRLTIQQSSRVSTDASNHILYNGVIVGTFTGGIGLTPLDIIFNAQATTSIVSDIAEQIAFSNVSQAPSTLDRSVEFILTDGKSGISAPAFKTVHVFAINDAPEINTDTSMLTVGAHQIADIGALSNLNITDVDGTANGIYLVNLTVRHGYLDFTNDLTDLDSLNFLQDPGNGRVSLTFTGNLADINAALARLTYVSRGNYVGTDTLSISTIDFGSSLLGGIAAEFDWLSLKVVA